MSPAFDGEAAPEARRAARRRQLGGHRPPVHRRSPPSSSCSSCRCVAAAFLVALLVGGSARGPRRPAMPGRSSSLVLTGSRRAAAARWPAISLGVIVIVVGGAAITFSSRVARSRCSCGPTSRAAGRSAAVARSPCSAARRVRVDRFGDGAPPAVPPLPRARAAADGRLRRASRSPTCLAVLTTLSASCATRGLVRRLDARRDGHLGRARPRHHRRQSALLARAGGHRCRELQPSARAIGRVGALPAREHRQVALVFAVMLGHRGTRDHRVDPGDGESRLHRVRAHRWTRGAAPAARRRGWCAASSFNTSASRRCARTCGCIGATAGGVTAGARGGALVRGAGRHELPVVLLRAAAGPCRNRPSARWARSAARVPDLISFAPGYPAPDSFPVGRVRRDRG